jgi:hypothetical protein
VTSSQLNNPELENKIVALVRGFSFGSGGFEPWTGNHIINLFPQ